jgi:hypothetical protein
LKIQKEKFEITISNQGSSPKKLPMYELAFAPTNMAVLYLSLCPPLHFETVSQLCFEVVAAIFRLRKLLKFNIPFLPR